MQTSAAGTWGTVKAPFSEGGFVAHQVDQVWTTLVGYLKDYILPLSNLLYVTVMLWGFAKLPANFMLVAGVLTLFVGPLVARYTWELIVAGVTTAAFAPFVIIFAAWV